MNYFNILTYITGLFKFKIKFLSLKKDYHKMNFS